MNDWIATLFQQPDLLRMGHGQRSEDLNLGLGWLYYGLTRAIRPSTIVAIGSFRGFVPLVLGKASQDNVENGRVYFIDPSLVDDFWKDPARVTRHFESYGVRNVRHFRKTTQEFVQTAEYAELKDIGLLFVDGYHSEEQARFDYEAFRDRLAPNAVTLFHDSVRVRTSRVYGADRLYEHRVKCYMDTLKRDPGLQVFDVPLFDGVTLVRKAIPASEDRRP